MNNEAPDLKGNVDLTKFLGQQLAREIEENRKEVISKMRRLAGDLNHYAEQFEAGREIEELNLTKSRSLEIDRLLLKLSTAETMLEQLS